MRGLKTWKPRLRKLASRSLPAYCFLPTAYCSSARRVPAFPRPSADGPCAWRGSRFFPPAPRWWECPVFQTTDHVCLPLRGPTSIFCSQRFHQVEDAQLLFDWRVENRRRLQTVAQGLIAEPRLDRESPFRTVRPIPVVDEAACGTHVGVRNSLPASVSGRGERCSAEL